MVELGSRVRTSVLFLEGVVEVEGVLEGEAEVAVVLGFRFSRVLGRESWIPNRIPSLQAGGSACWDPKFCVRS